jgi:para-nitrobenzyl esterase
MKKLLILLVLAAAVAGYLYLRATPVASDDTVRQLTSGQIIGFKDQQNTYAWLGIPFAKPPLGDLRWRAPQSAESWSGVRESIKHAPMCAQVYPFAWPDRLITLGNEDCLYLDVWSPRLAQDEIKDAKLPVMVWIHGGANKVGGASATRSYNIAGRENVVVVSLQYRLGLLGWFSHPALRDTANSPLDASSNFAILDMVAALQWVRDNAAAFGGDPNNVTIFGQSAGAFDVYALLGAPQAKGLFHRAIAQSGNIQTVPQTEAENYVDDPTAHGQPDSFREIVNQLLVVDGKAINRAAAKQVQDAMSAEDLAAYLRGKTTEELFQGVERRVGLGYFSPTNIRDGIVFPHQSLLEVFADPRQYNAVPLIVGNNRDEYKFFLWDHPNLTETRYGVLPEIKNVQEYNRVTRYFSDQWQVIGVNEPAAVLAKSQPGEVFAYRFDWAGQKRFLGIDVAELIGAGHGLENTFVFGPDAVDGLSMFAVAENKESRAALEDAMRGYWAEFARTGRPGDGGDANLPEWLPWQQSGPNKLILDRAEASGIHMSEQNLTARQLAARIKNDPAIKSDKERCELYAQVFYHALTTDFWDQEEYEALGCVAYPREVFDGVM